MENFSFDVFLSYSNDDIEIARSIASMLRDCGFRVWFAEEQLVPGSRFRAGLEQGLRESQNLVAILTNSYIQRHWTQREIDLFDLTADRNERKILAIKIGEIYQSRLDQVFLVHQRINWNSTPFDPEAFWLLNCGLTNHRPGPKSNWKKTGMKLIQKSKRKTTKADGAPIRKGFVTYHNIIPHPVEELVDKCLYSHSLKWQPSYKELVSKVKELEKDNIAEKAIVNPWSIGQTEYAAVVSLAHFPKIHKHYSAWALIDLGLNEIARLFLLAMSLTHDIESEIWFSWAVSEKSWALMPHAAQKTQHYIREHFSSIAKAAAEKKISFKKFESTYNYGIMITPWNNFHLTWLAIRLNDLDAAKALAIALCAHAINGDPRAGRFLSRLSNWNCFDSIMSDTSVLSKVNHARSVLCLTEIDALHNLKARITEIWHYSRLMEFN